MNAPSPHYASLNDIVQKTVKPNVGAIGIVVSTNDKSVVAFCRSPRVDHPDGDEFNLAHGEYAIVGRAVVGHFPEIYRQRMSGIPGPTARTPRPTQAIAPAPPPPPVPVPQPMPPAAAAEPGAEDFVHDLPPTPEPAPPPTLRKARRVTSAL